MPWASECGLPRAENTLGLYWAGANSRSAHILSGEWGWSIVQRIYTEVLTEQQRVALRAFKDRKKGVDPC